LGYLLQLINVSAFFSLILSDDNIGPFLRGKSETVNFKTIELQNISMKTNESNDQRRERKTRILAVSDIHGDRSLTKRLAEKVRKNNIDLVILAGDLTTLEYSTEGLIGPFIEAGAKVMLIPGNHETLATANFLAEQYSDTINIHGYGVEFNNIGIFGVGGANIGPFNIMQESDISKLLDKGHSQIKHLKSKIMVTHLHPSGSITEKLMPYAMASKAIEHAIRKFQPDIAISGHIHQGAGLENKIGKTRVINVARKEAVFEI
jgi:hypothetical protein